MRAESGAVPKAPQFRSPEEVRAATPERPEFVWDGYLARGAVVLLAGKPKSGKSTLAFAVAEAMVTGASSFLGRRLTPGPVVYVSEEDDSTVRAKLPPDGTPLRILTRGAAWPRPSWAALIEAAVEEAERVRAALLVVDTLAFWSDLKAEQEKDAGAAAAAMETLLTAANAGLAVLLVHHQRKSGGEDGDAVRGSSALAGAADAIVELEPPREAPPGQRRLVARARWSVPGMLLVERSPATGAWRMIGEGTAREDAGKIAWRDALLRALPVEEPGATYDDLAATLRAEKPKWHLTLTGLVEDGLVARSGAGKKGSPFRFRKARMNAVPECRPPTRTETADARAEAIPSKPSAPRRGEADGIKPSREPSSPIPASKYGGSPEQALLSEDEVIERLKRDFSARDVTDEEAA